MVFFMPLLILEQCLFFVSISIWGALLKNMILHFYDYRTVVNLFYMLQNLFTVYTDIAVRGQSAVRDISIFFKDILLISSEDNHKFLI